MDLANNGQGSKQDNYKLLCHKGNKQDALIDNEKKAECLKWIKKKVLNGSLELNHEN